MCFLEQWKCGRLRAQDLSWEMSNPKKNMVKILPVRSSIQIFGARTVELILDRFWLLGNHGSRLGHESELFGESRLGHGSKLGHESGLLGGSRLGCGSRLGHESRLGHRSRLLSACEYEAWVMTLVPWALDGTAWAWARASFDGKARDVVAVPWTSPRVVVTVVVAMVEPRSDGAVLMITFSLVDLRGPIS
ncbi:hypothetical protein ACFX1Z_004584 [Malus domestica]